jgi:hypothetical protein
MKTWLWPLTWYYRIKELETLVELLKIKNREIDATMRAQAVSSAAVYTTYVASMTSMAADYEKDYQALLKRSTCTCGAARPLLVSIDDVVREAHSTSVNPET